MLKVG
jgi:hypothetical protein